MKQKKIKIKTPAKINLSLEIIDKFPNGFHSISSVMQTVSLFDYLTFSLSETGKENQIISRIIKKYGVFPDAHFSKDF